MNKPGLIVLLVVVGIIGYQMLTQLTKPATNQPVQFGVPNLRLSKLEIEEGNGVAVGTDIHIRGEIINTGQPFKGLKLLVKGKSLSKRLLTLSEGSSLQVTQGDLLTAPQTERLPMVIKKGIATALLPDVRCVEPVLAFRINMTALKTGKGELEITVQPVAKNAKPVKEKLVAFIEPSATNVKVATQTKDRTREGLNGLFIQIIADDFRRQNPNYIPPEQRADGYRTTEDLQGDLDAASARQRRMLNGVRVINLGGSSPCGGTVNNRDR